MNLIQRALNMLRKDSEARIALAFNQVGQPVYTEAKYLGFTKQGYEKNVMVYACIRKIATACAGIEWELYNKRKGGEPVEVEDSPLLDLLAKPNPLQARAQFFEAMVSFYLLTGNTYVEANRPSPNAPPLELWTMRPDLVYVVPNKSGYVGKYVFDTGAIKKVFPVDVVSMQGNVLHIKTFHPTDIWYGLSPLSAGMIAVDQNNATNRSNLALVQNNSTPSGVVSVRETKSNATGNLSKEQFDRLKDQIDDQFQPNKNNKPILLEGGLDFKPIAWSPKEMEFLNNKRVTAEDICLIFGVPPEIMGLGKTTYANYAEAMAAFYKNTILPLMDLIKTDFNNWLVPMYDQKKQMYLEYCKDDIEALQYLRDEKMKSLEALSYLQLNEKREAAGYEPKPGWDVFIIGGTIYSEPDSTDGASDETTNDQQDALSSGQAGAAQAEDETTQEDESQKAFKTFNLFTANEKKTTLKRVNARRSRLEKGFDRDLRSDFSALVDDVKRAMKSSNDVSVLKFAVQKAVDENETHIKNTIGRHVKYTVYEFGEQTLAEAKSVFAGQFVEKKADRQWESWAESYVKRRTTEAFSQIQNTTKTQIRRMMSKVEDALIKGETIDEIVADMTNEYANVTKSRATLIARTEVGSASTNSTLQAAKSLQVPNMVKTWLSSQDDRTRDGEKNGPDHLNMNDIEVPIDEKFTVPPDTDMDCPGDTSAGADQICNCRCAITFTSRA